MTRSGQKLYAGFVKPGEVAHDAAIYRMYQAEAARIEKAGGKIRRVILDYELKQKVYSPLAKAKGACRRSNTPGSRRKWPGRTASPLSRERFRCPICASSTKRQAANWRT